MFALKKLIFKFMELGLGLRTCFSLETKNPIFINFRLTEPEAAEIQKRIPPTFSLQRIKFYADDTDAHYWLSYNFYALLYPKKELAHIRKSRCEINTFVVDAHGRPGIFVFAGSPYVSKETKRTVIGTVCDFAERMVTFIYGCGRLIPLQFELGAEKLRIELDAGGSKIDLACDLTGESQAGVALSGDYWRFNDISFFNQGKTHDFVNVSYSFYAAKFNRVGGELPVIKTPFFSRRPDNLGYHRGDIAYLVNSMNRS